VLKLRFQFVGDGDGGAAQGQLIEGVEVGGCDRTTSEMMGLPPKIISGDSRRSENA
jgi:hypothetical protein